ncbi:MAG: zinc-binding dehydrogenase [Elusimicrobia bacterium]|nr:zinc-binding dehydrogenase [Elusimicrobiota bacterium]
MKAAILYELNKPLKIEKISIPKLNEGQVLVKVIASGICHSQLNEIKGKKGPDKFLPHTLGHEGVGIVREIGSEVKKVKIGDYVVLTWIKGEGLDVPSALYYGSDGTKINSGAISTFMEYAIISENRLVVISEKVPFKAASLLGCAVPTGAGIVKNSVELKKENSIAIFGIGGIGSSSLLYAGAVGCRKIIAIDNNNSKLDFAKKLGATDTIDSGKENVVLKIKEMTGAKGVDYAIEASGVKEVMEMAFDSIKDKGTAVIAGNLRHGDKISINPFDLIKGKKIVGTWGGETNSDRDIPLYADMYLSGKLKLDMLVTHTYSLDDINCALEDLERGKVGRALIDMSYECDCN